MKRSLILAALAAFSTLSATGSAFAESELRVDDETICRLLEAAHETTCEEFEVVRSERSEKYLISTILAGSPEITGGIEKGSQDLAGPATVPPKR